MNTDTNLPSGRDNIPLNHPRRIAKIAYAPEHFLRLQTPEIQRLCAEFREKEAARYAEWQKANPSTQKHEPHP